MRFDVRDAFRKIPKQRTPYIPVFNTISFKLCEFIEPERSGRLIFWELIPETKPLSSKIFPVVENWQH